jgi:Bacterial toxin 34
MPTTPKGWYLGGQLIIAQQDLAAAEAAGRLLDQKLAALLACQALMAARGNISNEIVDQVKKLIHGKPNLNPCDVLDEMMAAAKAAGDTALTQKIKTAQKYFKCRRHRGD